MTWADAYRHADDQIEVWKRTGVTADEAAAGLLNLFPMSWVVVRRMCALWAMRRGEKWED